MHLSIQIDLDDVSGDPREQVRAVLGHLPDDAPYWTLEAMRLEAAESQSGVALYYHADTSRLHGVAVGLRDSRRSEGWQPVELDGLQLVGRPRELVEDLLADRYGASHEMYYGPAGDFGFDRLGLGIRTVRSWPTGLVTRALFVSKQITESCWDDYEGYLRRDWDKHR